MLRLAFSLKSGWFFLAFCSIIGTRRLHKEFPQDPLVHLVVSAATCPKAQSWALSSSAESGTLWAYLMTLEPFRSFGRLPLVL